MSETQTDRQADSNRFPGSQTAGAADPGGDEPGLAEAMERGCFLAATAQARKVLAGTPEDEENRLRLAQMLFAAGDMVAAQAEADWVTRFAANWGRRIEAWRISVAAAPYCPGIDVLDLRALSQRWSGHLLTRRLGLQVPPAIPRVPGLPLRVGYLIGDLPRDGRFWPLGHHDPERVQARAFWCGPSAPPDPAFEDLSAVTSVAAAAHIRQYDLDLLVDLCPAGFAAADMLTMMRPARLQVGMMNRLLPDYDAGHDRLLGDAALFGGRDFADGEGAARETMSRPVLPILPGAAIDGAVPTAPAGTGRLTLAALPDGARVDADSIDLWAQLMSRLPGARFLVAASRIGDATAERIIDGFARAGVDPLSITLAAGESRLEILARADLVLDGFTGGSDFDTVGICAAGAPVLALRGDRLAARRSASILTAMGHDELVVDATRDRGRQALQAAERLCRDPQRLAAYRDSLPAAVRRVGLADPAGSTAVLEEALIGIWDRAVQAAKA